MKSNFGMLKYISGAKKICFIIQKTLHILLLISYLHDSLALHKIILTEITDNFLKPLSVYVYIMELSSQEVFYKNYIMTLPTNFLSNEMKAHQYLVTAMNPEIVIRVHAIINVLNI
jgi:hypothetical protein